MTVWTKLRDPATPSSRERKISTDRRLREGTVSQRAIATHSRMPTGMGLPSANDGAIDFQGYDLVVEVLADPTTSVTGATQPRFATIDAEAEWQPACSNGLVHEIVLDAIGQRVETGLPMHGTGRLELANIAATPSILDNTTPDAVSPGGKANDLFKLLFGGLRMLLGEITDKAFSIVASSCGHRLAGERANGDLKALVRVYRNASVSITFELPSRSANTYRRTSVTTRGPTPAMPPPAQPGQPTPASPGWRPNPRNRVIERSEVSGGVGMTERGTGSAFTAPSLWSDSTCDLEVRGVRERFKLEVKINDVKVDLGDTIRRIFDLVKTILDASSRLAELIKKLPQMGFGLTWSLELLSGQFTIAAARQESNDVIDGRLLPAPLTGQATGQVTFFNASIEASFGLYGNAEVVEVEARATLGISGSSTGSITASRSEAVGFTAKLELTGELNGRFSAVATVNVMGVFSFSAQLEAATGISITGTVFDTTRGGLNPYVTAKLKRGYVTGSIRGISRSWEAWPERPLWTAGGAEDAPDPAPRTPRQRAQDRYNEARRLSDEGNVTQNPRTLMSAQDAMNDANAQAARAGMQPSEMQREYINTHVMPGGTTVVPR